MNELMKSNPSKLISLIFYYLLLHFCYIIFTSFYEQTSFSILKTILIVERYRYRTSPCGDDKSILTFVLQQNGAVAGDWRLDIGALQQFVFF